MAIDLRSQLPPARDQGSRSTCVAFAAGAFNDVVAGASHSTEFLAWCAVEVSGVDDESAGLSLQAAGDALTRLGQPPESRWPYQVLPAGAPPISAFRVARLLRRTAHKSQPGFNQAIALAELTAHRTVLLGLRLTPTFFAVTSSRPNVDFDRPLSPTSTFLHAVALVGHLETAHPWLLRNSWGTGWGDAGHAYASDAFLNQHVLEMLTVEE